MNSRAPFFVICSLLTFSAFAETKISITPGSCDKINAAIKSLPAEGGRVFLAAGQYDCDVPVVISQDNVKLIGAGREKTILKLAAGKALPALVIGVLEVAPQETKKHGTQFYPQRETRNVEVSGLTVLGDFHGQKPDNDRECYDPEKNESSSCDNDGGRLVRNNGVTIRRSRHVLIHDVRADHHLSGGLVVEKLSSELVVDGFYASHNAFDGFAGYETQGSLLKNVVLSKNTMSGVSIDFDFDHNTFDHVDLLDNGDNGVFSHSVTNVYKNMRVARNRNFGIYIDGRREKQADGSIKLIQKNCDDQSFENVSIADNRNAGLRFNSTCQNLTFKNTRVRTASKAIDCISLFTGAQAVSLGGNTCHQGGVQTASLK